MLKKKIYKIISGYAFESMTEEEINKTVDKIVKVFNEKKDEIYWKGYDRAMKVMEKQDTVDD